MSKKGDQLYDFESPMDGEIGIIELSPASYPVLPERQQAVR